MWRTISMLPFGPMSIDPIHEVTLTMIALQNAGPKPARLKPGSRSATRASIAALMTSRKKPSVTSVSGSVKPPVSANAVMTPDEPTYACVVDGDGKTLFGGTLSEAQSFKAKRIKINLGRTTVKVTVNKKALDIPPSSNPVGYDLRAGKTPVELPLGSRPNC